MGRVEACRICLITDVKMERIQGSLETNIKSVFGHNVLNFSDLPEYSCYECSALIAKFSKFRKKYLTAQSLLFNILQNHGVVTEKEIKNLDRVASKLNSNLSTTLDSGDKQLVEIKVECDPMEDELHMTVEEEIDNSGSEDDVPLHSVKQIEHVNINPMKKNGHTSSIKKRNMNTEIDSGESSSKKRKSQGNNGRNEKLLKDFDVTKLTDRADANGVVYLQAEDFDTDFPDMDNTIEEYSPSSSALSMKILENQNLMLNNQHTIMCKLADFTTRFQSTTMTNMLTRTGASSELFTAKISSPVIENKEQLDKFENDLKDPEKRQMLRNTYSILFNGRGIGYNCAYMLVDAIFSRKFLTLCSWCGGSRGEDSKIPFKVYNNTISFFHEIVHECDNNFSMLDCYKFIKVVLKNSIQRFNSKILRMSTLKNRRKRRVNVLEET